MQKGNFLKFFKSLEMQKWNIPTDTAQRLDEKNGVIFLDIMFTLGVMVIKMSKMAYFLYFLLWQKLTVWAKYFSTSERS